MTVMQQKEDTNQWDTSSELAIDDGRSQAAAGGRRTGAWDGLSSGDAAAPGKAPAGIAADPAAAIVSFGRIEGFDATHQLCCSQIAIHEFQIGAPAPPGFRALPSSE